MAELLGFKPVGAWVTRRETNVFPRLDSSQHDPLLSSKKRRSADLRRSPQVPSCCETNGSAMNSSWPGGPEYGGHVKVSFDLVSVQFWKALCLTTESSCSNQFVDYTFCRRRKQFHDSAPASFTTLVTPGLVRWMEV